MTVPTPYVGYPWVTSLVLNLAIEQPVLPANTKVSYQWLRNDVPIRGAVGARYRTATADSKKAVRLNVRCSRAGYATESTNSNA
jgi:hypothetical protein